MSDLTQDEITSLEQAISKKHASHTESEPIPLRIAKVALSPLPETEPASPKKPSPWMDLPVTCKVLLGSSRLTLGQLDSLETGSQITLDQLTDQPLEIQANGRTIARGELITADGQYGIRITQFEE